MNPTLARTVRAAIEDHLADYPQAADSAAGVARWWLTPRGINATATEVELVLAEMVHQHHLRGVLLADGTVLYSRTRAPLH
ncbi:hypothetical protein D621_01490 [beta proteobacterium AAP51]|nr:hypothetical protein D621_01490 [beta proteobacterium AAP51]